MPGQPIPRPLRFAIIGAGFWSRFQLAAWKELDGAVCAAVCDRNRARAEALARDFGVPAVYDDAEALLRKETLDFVDIIAGVEAHGPLVRLAAASRLPAICQKPLAATLEEAAGLVDVCRRAGTPLAIHENWRWQAPIRQVRRILDAGVIGVPFRARIDMISGFEGWINQPALQEMEQFILLDLGVHVLDAARFLFGEASSLYCETHRTLELLRGENVATVLLNMNGGKTTVVCEMAYAGNPLERECFPQTLIFIEGTLGSLEVAPDYWIRTTTAASTEARRHPPASYPWVDPAYAVVQSSIVDCNRDLLRALEGGGAPETGAEDNLETLRLVFGAYRSAAEKRAIDID